MLHISYGFKLIYEINDLNDLSDDVYILNMLNILILHKSYKIFVTCYINTYILIFIIV